MILKEIEIKQENLDLGVFVMEDEFIVLKQVIVESRRVIGVQNGDIMEFNVVVFKMMCDVSVQILVEKFFGVIVENGIIQV